MHSARGVADRLGRFEGWDMVAEVTEYNIRMAILDGAPFLTLDLDSEEQLPELIRRVRGLHTVHLGVGPGFVVPDWFSGLRIRSLSFTSLGFARIPEQFGQLPNLRHLTWVVRDFTIDEQWLPALPGVKVLEVSARNLVSVPDTGCCG
jgi:hypothetical protein